MEQPTANEFDVVAQIVHLLDPLNPGQRALVLRTLQTWLGLEQAKETPSEAVRGPSTRISSAVHKSVASFSDRQDEPPKDFLLHKDPHTDVERVACLAYYLKHYRDTPYFKTLDLSVLNTEAAQRKLSNPTVSANNAARDGFFVPASKKGSRQLSAMGERFVQELPDRNAAMAIRNRMKNPRRFLASAAEQA